jgi:uncharacterized lipoprotein YehR (DUF1307 family)
MLRKFTIILIALLCMVGIAAAEDKKDTKTDKKDAKLITIVGTFESYKDEKLTLKVEGKERTFAVPGDTLVGYTAGKDKKKVLKAKEHLKKVKKGAFVAVTHEGAKVFGVGVVVAELPADKPKEKAKDE